MRRRIAWIGWWAFGLVALAGCVERRYIIHTRPTGAPPTAPDLGAMVFNEKGLPLSPAPADSQFVYYGKYRFTAVKDGYQTKIYETNLKAPWYEWFPFDFISENIVPWTIRDVRHIDIELEPIQAIPPEVLLQNAQTLQQKARVEGSRVPPMPTAVSTSQTPKMPEAK